MFGSSHFLAFLLLSVIWILFLFEPAITFIFKFSLFLRTIGLFTISEWNFFTPLVCTVEIEDRRFNSSGAACAFVNDSSKEDL